MIFKKHNKFKPYLSIEKADDHTVNPKRGWYSIYPFTLPERPDFEELQWCLKKQESLCLVRVCIGNYAAADKSGYGDSVLRALFTAFSGCGGTCRGTGAGAFKNVGGAWILFEGAKYAESCTADL